jgi:biotin synthase
MINQYIKEAYKILEGKELDKSLIIELSKLEGEDILDLTSLANKVKNRYSAEAHVCTIMNAKSGLCKENCKFCAQSLHNNADVDRTPLSDVDEVVKKAGEAHESGVKSFGIVTSGTGYRKNNKEFQQIIDSMDKVYETYPDMHVCASIGFLSDETAEELSKHKAVHYNINLQTSTEKYKELISDSHEIEEKIETIKLLKKHDIKVCSGGIIGLGETMKDRIDMAYTLKELDVDVIPLNVLIPVDGTPLEGQEPIPVAEIAKTFAIYRLIHPTKTIKFAAGRETKMKDFQGLLMLSGANGFLTGGYLTTRGREVADDKVFGDELKQF